MSPIDDFWGSVWAITKFAFLALYAAALALIPAAFIAKALHRFMEGREEP